MDFARDRHTGKIVHADEARGSAFSCPTCSGRASLRAGVERRAHFAHYPGEGSAECEEYHPGAFGGAGADPRPSKDECEDEPGSLGLAVAVDGQAWALLLRLPEIPTEELGTASIGDLSRARVDVYCGSTRAREVPALDVRPGVGVARVAVPPSLQPYNCQAVGQWPDSVNLERWADLAPGLSAAGTLFRLRSGEWTRLRDRALVEWGESLLLVADDRSPPPRGLVSEVADGISTPGLLWRLWRVTLPASPDSEAAAWLEGLGHEVRAPSWRVRFLTVPTAYGEGGAQFEAGVPLLVELDAPAAATTASVAVTLGRNVQTTLLPAPADGALYAEICSSITGAGLLEIIERGLVKMFFEFVRPGEADGSEDPPRLRVRIGSNIWEPWRPAPARKAERTGDVEVDTGVDGARLDIVVWLRGGKRRVMSGVTPEEVVRVLNEVLEEAEIVEIDAGNLGRVTIPVGARDRAEPGASRPNRLTGWLESLMASAAVTSSGDSVPHIIRRCDNRPSSGRAPSWLTPLVRARARMLR